MIRNFRKAALAFAGFCAVAFAPDSGQAESLRDAVRAALGAHPSVQTALAQRTVAREEEREQYAGLFPEVNANLSGGRIFGDNSTSRGLNVTRGEAYSWLWEGSATVTQPLFDGRETFNRIDAARARFSSAGYEVADAQESLALRTVQSYLNLLRAEEVLAHIRSYRNTLADYLIRIERMVEEGAADRSEVQQAQNLLKLLENRQAEFEGDVESAGADYREVVGRAPKGSLRKPGLTAGAVPEDVGQALLYAKKNHPLLLASAKEMEAALHGIDAEKGTIYPDLDGELSYLQRDQVEELGGELLDKRALLRLSWNFSTGGAQLARIRRSKAEYSKVLAESQETQRRVEREIRQSYTDMATTGRQSDILEEREEIIKGLLKTYEAQFEGSRVRLLQLMQAENQIFSTRLERINSTYFYLAAQYAVLASMGKLVALFDLDNDLYLNGMTRRPIMAKAEDLPPLRQTDIYTLKKNVPEQAEKTIKKEKGAGAGGGAATEKKSNLRRKDPPQPEGKLVESPLVAVVAVPLVAKAPVTGQAATPPEAAGIAWAEMADKTPEEIIQEMSTVRLLGPSSPSSSPSPSPSPSPSTSPSPSPSPGSFSGSSPGLSSGDVFVAALAEILPGFTGAPAESAQEKGGSAGRASALLIKGETIYPLSDYTNLSEGKGTVLSDDTDSEKK